MNTNLLKETVRTLMTPKKGILAADESTITATKRLAAIHVESTPETRRQYRELLLTTPGIEKYLSGVILYDETIRQETTDGQAFPQLLSKIGIIPGIKVDRGTIELPDFPGERITQGLDDLTPRLEEYFNLGARFTKWRAVINIGQHIPTNEAIQANAFMLAEFANLSQQNDMVPIVEPEVIHHGDHSLERAEEVTTWVLKEVFSQLQKYRVDLEFVVLKSSMVLPGDQSPKQVPPKTVAEATVRTLRKSVPAEVGGVVFLSGGQPSNQAINNLNAIAQLEPLPWEITFSYARALQEPVLSIWQGSPDNWKSAQQTFLELLQQAVLADQGKLSS